EIAGTHFGDHINASNAASVDNAYYYVGALTSPQSPGGPASSFVGNNTGWNVAIMPDDMDNYQFNFDGQTMTFTNVKDPLHAGSLALTNVQAISFSPTESLMPDSSNTVHASGNQLAILNSTSVHIELDGSPVNDHPTVAYWGGTSSGGLTVQTHSVGRHEQRRADVQYAWWGAAAQPRCCFHRRDRWVCE